VRITAVEAIPYALPRHKPARFASGAIARADNVLIRIHTDQGLVGQAEAQPRPYTYGETQESIVATVRERAAPRLLGLDPLRTELAQDRCAAIEDSPVACGALDLAIWDLAGQALGRSCLTLLGGFATDVAVAAMLSVDTPAAMAEEALALNERDGVEVFKVKVGRDVEVDVAACRAIREALPDARLYVDANRGWTQRQASRAAAGLSELGIVGIEEPIAVDDRAGRLRLSRQWRVPLIGDESCTSLARTNQALDEGAVGMVSVKTARTGFTESRRILGLCLGRSVPVVVGSQYEGGIGALATAAFAAAHAGTAKRAAELANVRDLADDLVVAPLEIRGGRFAPPASPGLGIEIDEEKLSFYRLDRPESSARRSLQVGA
jgi:L-Ala-D/L-Glu epimerase